MLFRSNDTATTEIYTVMNTLSLHDAPDLGITGIIAFIAFARAPSAYRHTQP